MMELRHLKYFIAVAETQHFRRAAKSLKITEPSLSRQMKALEAELGFELFQRQGRGTVLSDAGKSFYNDVVELTRSLQKSIDRAALVSRGQAGVLRIGLSETAARNPIVTRSIYGFRERHPAVELSINPNASTKQHLANLEQGRIDVGFVFKEPGALPVGIESQPVCPGEMMLAVPIAHPLSSFETVNLSELRNHPLILISPEIFPVAFDEFMRACVAAGFRPRVTQEAAPSLLPSLVSAGIGLGVISSLTKSYLPDDVVFRPIDGLEMPTVLYMIWDGRSESPTVRLFISFVQGVVEKGAGARWDSAASV